MLVRFQVKFFNGLISFILDFCSSCGKLLLPLFKRQPPLRRHRLRSRFACRCLDLLLGIGYESRNLSRQLE